MQKDYLSGAIESNYIFPSGREVCLPVGEPMWTITLTPLIMSEITSSGAPSLVGLFVSQPIHYLLNSISAVLMFIDYQSLSCKLLSFYSPSSNLPT